MSKRDAMRMLVKQRLDAAAEEIIKLFESTIADYERKLSHCKKRSRHHAVQEAGNTSAPQRSAPDVQRAERFHERSPADARQDPDLHSVKLEQEELSTNQLPKLEEEEEEEEEEEGVRFAVTAVCVKSEDAQQGADEAGRGPRTSSSFETEVGVDEVESLIDSEYETDNSGTDNDEDGWQKSPPIFEPDTSDFDRSSETSAVADAVAGVPESLFKRPFQRRLSYNSGFTLSRFMGEKCLGLTESQAKAPAGGKAFGCDVCGQTFNRKANLRAHMGVHTGVKPFQCDECGKRFRHPYNFRRHLRVHSGEKPFGCHVCSKRFSEQGVLLSHMNVHTGGKPFKCELCGRAFLKKSYLKSHAMVHTGEKPFGCAACGRGFTRKGDLKRHMLVHRRPEGTLEATPPPGSCP